MTVNDSEPRKLKFPLYYSENPLVVGGDLSSPQSVTPEWQTTDNDEIVSITLTVSLNEFVALASAIDVGRDIAYGEKSIELWQIWVKAVNTLSLCQQIADCIDGSQAVKDALLEFIRDGVPQDSGNAGTGTQLPEGTLSQNMVGGCNNNNLYAATTQLVDFVNAGIVDFLELVEAGTGRLERMNVAVSAIPIIGILPVDEALLFIDQIIENFMNNYSAQYTQTLRDEYACELFCIAQNNCELTFKDMADYFSAKAGATFDAITLAEALDWFIFGTWSGNLIVHGMHALFCWAIVWGSEFFGVNLNRIVRIVQAAYNDSDPDWEIICTDCSPDNPFNPCIQWNDLIGQGWEVTFLRVANSTEIEPITIDNTFGNPVPSAKAGFVTVSGLAGRDISVLVEFTEPQIFNGASFDYWFDDNGNQSARRRIALLDRDFLPIAEQETTANDAVKEAWTTYAWSGSPVHGVYFVRLLFYHLGNPAIYTQETASAWLDNVCVDTEPETNDFEPIVVWTNAACEDGFGASITDLGNGNWQITSVTNPKNGSALGVSFKDIYGRAFRVDNIEFSSSTGMYYGGAHESASCRQETYNWFTSPPIDLLQCDFQRAIGLGSFTVTFRAVLS